MHYSTDFVFDGERERAYDEFDPPSPQGLYARSKVAGEQSGRGSDPRGCSSLRVGCLYGRGGRNFPSTIVRRLRAGETVRADRDRLGSPTWVVEVARLGGARAHVTLRSLPLPPRRGRPAGRTFASFMAAELGLPESRVEPLPTVGAAAEGAAPARARSWTTACCAFAASNPVTVAGCRPRLHRIRAG